MKKIITEKEKKVLAGLYKIKNGSVYALAEEALINRTTLYPILEKLVKKGLVSRVKIEGRTNFQPISHEEFGSWVERKERELKKESQEFSDWINSQEDEKAVSMASETKYFEGMDGVKNLYHDSWRDNPEKMIYSICDYTKAYSTLGDFFVRDYFPKRIKHEVTVKSLLPKSRDGERDAREAKNFLREMRFNKLFKDLNIEINIYDDKLAIVAFDEIIPSGVLIKNKKIAEAMKNIFEYLWKSVKK
ncbi:MAG: hypothetical protein PF549_02670 [Patescibacteria group bacterium]|jgi:sugar-specific transcriptional regulator TrmB|nr:hypothetical protein [Patescibacteria group bacterium]